MIPKVLHYVWLSNDKKPSMIKRCLDSWSVHMPDYEIKCWSLKDFDIDKIPFVREAISVKKWAFATDYLRLYILYNFGGVYLDSDVLVRHKFDEFLDNDFFSFIEYHEEVFVQNSHLIDEQGIAKTDAHISGFAIQAAVMGATKGHQFVKTCMDFYTDKHFIAADGKFFNTMIAPDILAICARKFGFRYINSTQLLIDNATIYNSGLVAGSTSEITPTSYAVHLYYGSWRSFGFFEALRNRLRYNAFVRFILGKEKL